MAKLDTKPSVFVTSVFTSKKAEQLLTKAERLEAKAERMLEKVDKRTKAGRQAKAEAEKMREQASKWRAEGERQRNIAKTKSVLKNIEDNIDFNAGIYSKIQEWLSSTKAHNRQLVDYIRNNFESEVAKAVEGVASLIYAAFAEAYEEDPRIFDEWIYYSDGEKMSEASTTLREILSRFVDLSEDEGDGFEIDKEGL